MSILIFAVILLTLSFNGNRIESNENTPAKLSTTERAVILILTALSFGYNRTNETGDYARYVESFNYLQSGEGLLLALTDYEIYYPGWYLLNKAVALIGAPFNTITAIATACIYYTAFKSIKILEASTGNPGKNRIAYLTIFSCYSLPLVLSSFRTSWCLTLGFLGLCFLATKQRKFTGLTLIVLGMTIHPIGLIAVLLYALLPLAQRPLGTHGKLITVLIAVSISVSVSIFADTIIQLITNDFLKEKAETYITGEWSNYNYNESSEIYTALYVAVLTAFLAAAHILLRLPNKSVTTHEPSPIVVMTSLGFFYLLIAIATSSFRTIEIRLMIAGVIFHSPILISFLSNPTKITTRLTPVIYLLSILVINLMGLNILNTSYDFYGIFTR